MYDDRDADVLEWSSLVLWVEMKIALIRTTQISWFEHSMPIPTSLTNYSVLYDVGITRQVTYISNDGPSHSTPERGAVFGRSDVNSRNLYRGRYWKLWRLICFAKLKRLGVSEIWISSLILYLLSSYNWDDSARHGWNLRYVGLKV